MSRTARQPSVDLTVSPERMCAIRTDVRDHLVNEYHALQLVARLYRKAGLFHIAHRHEDEAERTALMIASIDDRPAPLLEVKTEGQD